MTGITKSSTSALVLLCVLKVETKLRLLVIPDQPWSYLFRVVSLDIAAMDVLSLDCGFNAMVFTLTSLATNDHSVLDQQSLMLKWWSQMDSGKIKKFCQVNTVSNT